MTRQWHYDGKKYCRPVFTYEEIEYLMLLMESVKELTGEMNNILYAKLMHHHNRMKEKAIAEGKADE